MYEYCISMTMAIFLRFKLYNDLSSRLGCMMDQAPTFMTCLFTTICSVRVVIEPHACFPSARFHRLKSGMPLSHNTRMRRLDYIIFSHTLTDFACAIHRCGSCGCSVQGTVCYDPPRLSSTLPSGTRALMSPAAAVDTAVIPTAPKHLRIRPCHTC